MAKALYGHLSGPVTDLVSEIVRLRQRVRELEERIRELELEQLALPDAELREPALV